MSNIVVCTMCGWEFDAKAQGWYNAIAHEGICDDCLEEHCKTELLDRVIGQ